MKTPSQSGYWEAEEEHDGKLNVTQLGTERPVIKFD